ncbi:thioredoxin-like protein [Xylaria sp. CBS 124048]|nr:thioredoxin-like protein [Xylaria sp. CBS 124048]
MGGKIECYVDIASYYSYIAFAHLQQNQALLEQNGVSVEYHPFLIAAVNAESGNRPPWLVKTKAKYLSKYDTKRAAEGVGLKNLSAPGDLMVAGRTIMPMRALLHIKAHYSLDVFITALGYMFHAFWTLHKVPITVPVLTEVLSEIPVGYQVGASPSSSTTPQKALFTPEQIASIVEAVGKEEAKAGLKATVDAALARGAFGAPWIWVTNASGKSEPFFGSDRWKAVYDLLGLPYQKLEVLPPKSKL